MHTLDLPTPPTFLSLDEERNHRKIRLAAAFRIFSRFGLDDGVTGHITARDPNTSTTFGSTPGVCPSAGSAHPIYA
jgi:hypothetical protein